MSITDPTLPSERSEQHKAHGAFWYKWLGHLKHIPNASLLELGCWQGESAEWFMDHIMVGDGHRLVTVDTFEGSEEHKLAGIDCSEHYAQACNRLKRFGWRAMVAKSTTYDFLADYLWHEKQEKDGAHLFDAIYVDAAHDAMNVLRDGVMAFELLKVGGVMIFDDFEWTVMEQPVDCPKIAVEAFLACYARRIEVIGYGWQVALKKLA